MADMNWKAQGHAMPNMDKKVALPAGGARAGNVQSKPGLPTKPSGTNTNFGAGKK